MVTTHTNRANDADKINEFQLQIVTNPQCTNITVPSLYKHSTGNR